MLKNDYKDRFMGQVMSILGEREKGRKGKLKREAWRRDRLHEQIGRNDYGRE